MKIIYVSCGVEELFEGRSSQLYTQLMQLRKESLKKIQACTGKPETQWKDEGFITDQFSDLLPVGLLA